MDEDALYGMYFLEHRGNVTYYLMNYRGGHNITFEFDDESRIPEHIRCFH